MILQIYVFEKIGDDRHSPNNLNDHFFCPGKPEFLTLMLTNLNDHFSCPEKLEVRKQKKIMDGQLFYGEEAKAIKNV